MGIIKEENNMEWFKKHVDTFIILGGILSATMWMNGKINDIEKDITIIKTVLVMKNIMPIELSCKNGKSDQSLAP